MHGEQAGRVAIAGASGFVGRALLEALAGHRDVIALARQVDRRATTADVEWRACDLFNLRDAERALAGAEVAVYLVHSMMPSARLTQGRFDDLDLICADNFARAAATNGVRHIVYLGGLLPRGNEGLSRHLQSRLEVEQTLGARGIPLTTLRAGLIIGAGGSSFEMMSRLVGRLPFMLGPRWTRSLSQPIALHDAVGLLVHAIGRPDLAGRAYDIGAPDVLSYADMLRMTGAAMGKRTRVVTLPVDTVRLSLLWVSVITGASQDLVRPLVDSLRHDMIATDGLAFQKEVGLQATPLRDALERALREERAASEGKAESRRARRREPEGRDASRGSTKADRRVCSVQRLPRPAGRDATWVAEEYVRWLPRFMRPLLRVVTDAERTCSFYLWPFTSPLLVLRFQPDRSAPDRQLFFVTEGSLVATSSGARARLEFRDALDGSCVLAAIHDFVPRLPWYFYKYTQALVHLLVMRSFARHLAEHAT